MQSRQQKSIKGTEERVREAALTLFARKGFQATGIRDIGAEAGLSISTLYYYVGTKEELLFDILRDILEFLLHSAEPVAARDATADTKLSLLVLLHVWVHGKQPRETQIARHQYSALSGEALQQIHYLRDRYDAVWRDVVAQGKEEKLFQVQDAKLSSIAMIEMCSGIAEWYRPGGPLSLEDLCLMHADLALGLVRATRNGVPIRVQDLVLPAPVELINGNLHEQVHYMPDPGFST